MTNLPYLLSLSPDVAYCHEGFRIFLTRLTGITFVKRPEADPDTMPVPAPI